MAEENIDLQTKVKDLEKKNKELEKSLKAQEGEKSEAVKVINDLKEKYASAVAKAEESDGEVVVEHGGKSYLATAASFRYKGEKYAAESLKSNKKLVGELVKKGAGVLKEKNG